MANIMLAFPDKAADATVSGGSWVASLPAANMLTTVVTQIARTTGVQASATTWTVDLGRSQAIQAIGFVNHNWSLSARVRIEASQFSTFSALTYDSGLVAPWPAIYQTADLEWEDDAWWSGTIDANAVGTMRPTFVLPLSVAQVARFWRFTVDDATNGAGYLQLGRLFMAQSWTPSRNPAYGWGLRWQPDADVEKALGGSLYFSPRSSARVMRFALDFLDADEAYSRALEMQRVLGADGQVLVVSDAGDESTLQQRSFLANISAASEVRIARPGSPGGVHSVDIELKEAV